MHKISFMKALRITILSLILVLVVAGSILGGLMLDSFYFQHERAAVRWAQREPYHYQYTVTIDSSFWKNSFMVEIQDGAILQTLDRSSGLPAEIWKMAPGSYLHETNTLWDYMLIDRIFKLIDLSRRPPKTFTAFLTRLNPGMYFSLAYRGWLPNERTTCDPAFPRVSYNRDYGYPEQLVLSGSPCATIMELVSPISIRIETFQVLP